MQLVIDEHNAGRRVDAVVRRLLRDMPLGVLMTMIRTGAVRLNGGRCRGATRLQARDTLHLRRPSPMSQKATATHRLPGLEVVFEDDDLLVVNKPAGLACHQGTNCRDDHLMARVMQHVPHGGVGRAPGLCQRLDAGVSGLLIVGKHASALRALSADVEAGRIDKRYVAVVDGRVAQAQGCIDAPLRVGDQPLGDRPRTLVDVTHGLPAVTTFRRIASARNHTVLCVSLETGRTHQIRAHLRHLGHPLLGDPRYGDKARNTQLFETFGLRYPALHAASLRFVHPRHRRCLSFAVPLPTRLVAIAMRR